MTVDVINTWFIKSFRSAKAVWSVYHNAGFKGTHFLEFKLIIFTVQRTESVKRLRKRCIAFKI
jgi:hypothetical protein